MHRFICVLAILSACGDNNNGNRPPVIDDLNLTTDEDTQLTRALDATDPEGDTIAFTAGQPAHGTVTTVGGSFTYTPEANFHGVDMFTITASDGTLSDSAVVSITVSSVNDPPTGVADTFATSEDTPHTTQTSVLLANDSDVDNDTLTITAVGGATNGTVVKTGNDITFTPTLNFTGSSTYRYTLSDGMATTDVTVTLTVGGVNDAPVAVDDAVTTPEDMALVVTGASLVANDTDPEGATLSVTAVSGATHGTVALASGMVTYTPDANYNGPAQFNYTVSDGSLTDSGTVTVTITPVNDAPVANADIVTTNEDTQIVVTQATMIGNDTDIENDTLTVTGATNATGGTVTFAGGNVTFTPAANVNGTAAGSFQYTLFDGTDSSTGTVTVNITAVNDAPIAVDDMVMTNEDTASVVSTTTLLNNDTDIDSGVLTITGVGSATHGTVALAGGNVTFTPDANFFGTATYDYTVSDGALTDTGTVTVMVLPINDAPIANDDLVATQFQTPLNIPAATLLANDTDVDPSTTLTVQSVHDAADGSVALNGTTITFTPNTGFSGNASFQYTVTDGTLTDDALVTVVVAPGNAKDMLSFAFLDAENPALTADVTADITGTNITATVPFGTDITNLIAHFVHTGASVSVGGVPQTSGVTGNNFTTAKIYRVTAADNSTQDYTVTITIAPNTAKDITAFVFEAAHNASLTTDVTATINQGTGAITATVPFGTPVIGLVATFTTTGNVVTVGGNAQTSGSTANNFTNPVTYVVEAEDLSTKNYVVTVSIAPDPDDTKDMTSFAFLKANNPGLSADVTGVINGTNITATIPGGANGAALVATFTHTGAAVLVGAAPQTSGSTPNDFTAPVIYTVRAVNNSTKDYTVTLTINCETLPDPIDGDVTVSNGGVAPSTATYTCNQGFRLVGSNTRQCTAGTYNGTAPTCERKFFVVRVGDGTATLTNAATVVSLEERALTGGSLLNTYPMPVAVVGTNQPFTLGGTATSEGHLQLSTNNQYLTVAGYAVAPGTPAVAGTSNLSTDTTPTNRSVARIDGNGGIDTSTRLVNVFNTKSVRGVHSENGTSFYVAGDGTAVAGQGFGGVTFVTLGSAGANTVLNATSLTHNIAHIAGGNLYSNSATQILTVGTGLPTTSPQTFTAAVTGLTNSRGFAAFDRSPVVVGIDTIYIARDAGISVANTLNIDKYTFDGTTWTRANFTVTNAASQFQMVFLAAWPEGNNIRVVAVQSPSSASNRIFTFVDDGVSTTSAATVLAQAPTNTRFYGVAPAPTVAP